MRAATVALVAVAVLMLVASYVYSMWRDVANISTSVSMAEFSITPIGGSPPYYLEYSGEVSAYVEGVELGEQPLINVRVVASNLYPGAYIRVAMHFRNTGTISFFTTNCTMAVNRSDLASYLAGRAALFEYPYPGGARLTGYAAFRPGSPSGPLVDESTGSPYLVRPGDAVSLVVEFGPTWDMPNEFELASFEVVVTCTLHQIVD